jgi:hypothetical protein
MFVAPHACGMRLKSPPLLNEDALLEREERRSASDPFVVMTDNFGEDYPITAGELAAIETYLSDILDKLFDELPGASIAPAKTRRKA